MLDLRCNAYLGAFSLDDAGDSANHWWWNASAREVLEDGLHGSSCRLRHLVEVESWGVCKEE